MRSPSPALLTSLAMAWGCGPVAQAPAEGGEVGFGVWRAAIVGARVEAPCADVWACPQTRLDARGSAWRAPTEAACARDTGEASALRADLDALEGAIDEGTVRFDASQAAACVVDLEVQVAWARCQGLPVRLPRSCAAALSGRLGEGEACDLDAECAEGARCVAAGDDVCARVCQSACEGGRCEADCGSAFPPLGCYAVERPGAECRRDADCGAAPWMRCEASSRRCVRARGVAEGAGCAGSIECAVGSECVDGACVAGEEVALAAQGEACALSPGGGAVCGPGLACQGVDFEGDRLGRCAEPGGLGAPCGVFTQCALGLHCAGSRFGVGGVELGACAGGRAEGAPCTSGVECQSGRCGTEDGRCRGGGACP
jgi:hypothetical protein